MADSVVEKKETVAAPEKEVEKPAAEVAEEESKTSENGDAKSTENGEKAAAGGGDAEPAEESKEAENGDSTTTTEGGDACPVKRKSVVGAGDAVDGVAAEGASPEKKAKLEEPAAAAEVEKNGEEVKTAA